MTLVEMQMHDAIKALHRPWYAVPFSDYPDGET